MSRMKTAALFLADRTSLHLGILQSDQAAVGYIESRTSQLMQMKWARTIAARCKG